MEYRDSKNTVDQLSSSRHYIQAVESASAACVTNEPEIITPDRLLPGTIVHATTVQEYRDQPVNATADASDASVLECDERVDASIIVIGNLTASGPSESSAQLSSAVAAVRVLSTDLPGREASAEQEVVVLEPSESLARLIPAVVAIRVPYTDFLDREESAGQSIAAFPPLEPAARRTPPEVWLVVFAEIHRDVSYCFPLGKKEAPAFVISHVCRQWRYIAIDMCPLLWSRMAITVAPSAGRGVTKCWGDLTTMALRRSKQKPLTVVFMASDDEAAVPSLSEALFMLAESQRLHDIKLYLPSPFVPLLSVFKGRLPILRRSVVQAIGVISPPRHVSAFAVAPRLEEIAFAGFDARTTFDVPRANITSYDDARECYAAEDVHNSIVRNLHASPNLWSFRGVYQRDIPIRFEPFQAVECPNLHVFIASQGAVFRSVTLPAVKTIVIESLPPDGLVLLTDGDCFPALHDLILRSRCHLHLTELSVIDTQINNSIFDILSELTVLTTLSFTFTQWFQECDDIIHDIVIALSVVMVKESRIYCVAPALSRFNVSVAHSLLHFGWQEITFVCVHLADMVKRRHFPPSDILDRIAVSIDARTPFLRFSRLNDEVITTLANCRIMGHDIRLSGFVDGAYVANIIPGNLPAVLDRPFSE